MKVGDKLRVKNDDLEPKLSKGAVGIITYIDDYNGYLYVKFDKGDTTLVESVTLEMIANMFDLIDVSNKVVCPVVLTTWYKACDKYIGGGNG